MINAVRRVVQYRDLLAALAFRDIRVRYKQTFLGAAWAVAQPLAFMVVLTVVKSAIFREQHSEGVPHQVFLYSAMVPWMFFQSGLSFATISISGNTNLVKKIYFPRELFPLAAVLACVVDFGIASSIFAVILVFYHMPVTASLLWVPVLFGLEFLFVLAIALFVSASNVFYRDIKYLVPLGVQLLFFASPVFYSVSQVPEPLRRWYLLNPMAVVIDGFRQAILHGAGPDAGVLAVSAVTAGLCCALAYVYFKRLEGKFADLI